MSPLRFAARLAFPFALGALAAAQGHVWVVDDDGGAGVDFTVLKSAVEAASDGDTILVREGTYVAELSSEALAIVGKSLVIAADNGDEVVIRDVNFARALRIVNIAADQQVVLRGLRFDLASEGTASFASQILDNAGSVRIEDCVFRARTKFFDDQLLHVSNTASLVLTRCELTARTELFPTLLVQGSTVSCYDTVIAARNRTEFFSAPQPGGIALQATSSRVFLSGGRLQGGNGEDGVPFGLGCNGGADGGDAFVADGCDVVLQHVLLVPGVAGISPDPACSAGAAGEALQLSGGTFELLEGAAQRLAIDSPVREGHVMRLVFDAPGALAFALVSAQPSATELLPLGELLVASPAVLSFSGTVEAYGKTVMLPLGDLPPGVAGALYHVQGAFLDPVAGTVRLGNATAVTLLDASL